MAGRVVSWLREMHWDVYQEVTVRGPRADIVAVRGPLLWIIECKTSLGLSVLEQAWGWRGKAHYVSVATPSTGGDFVRNLLSDGGLGLISVGHEFVFEKIPARLFRRAKADEVRKRLREEHKTFAAAGNAMNRYYSPWRATCDAVARFVRANPGCTIKQLVEGIQHHYLTAANARASLRTWIVEGKVPGVRAVREGKLVTVVAA